MIMLQTCQTALIFLKFLFIKEIDYDSKKLLSGSMLKCRKVNHEVHVTMQNKEFK